MRYDPDSFSWRTCEVTLFGDSPKFSGIWPLSGSMRSGAVYEHPTLGRRTGGPGYSLLPTPTARDHKGRNQRNDATCLPGAVKLLPTPTAQQHNYDEDPENFLARRERMKAKGYNGNGAGLPLGMAMRLLPTPTASDMKGSRRSTARKTTWTSNPGTTLTDAAQELGGTTAPPSSGGKRSRDESHQTLW